MLRTIGWIAAALIVFGLLLGVCITSGVRNSPAPADPTPSAEYRRVGNPREY